MSLKKSYPPVRFNGDKIDPDEINRYENHTIVCPAAQALGSAWFGTAAANLSGSTSAFVITNQMADYPRNVMFTIVNTAGSLNAGTVSIVGKDQFGQAQTESFGYALGTATMGKAGTKIFSTVTAGSITFGTGQVQNGTPFLGVAGGTVDGSSTYWFGLPVRIGATSDLKTYGYAKNFVSLPMNGGTPTDLVSTTTHAVKGTTILGTADAFYLRILSSYNSESDPILA